MLSFSRRGVSPVIAIVLLLMMTVAAAGAAYFWITSMQSSVQQSAGSQIEAITKQASTRIIAQATLCKPPAEDDLVGYWKFDEGSGTTAEDSAGGNDGTINGASWVSYGERHALDFDGSDDYVNIGNPAELDISTGSFTLSAWVKSDDFENIWIAGKSGRRLDHWAGYKLYTRSGDLRGDLSNGTDAEVRVEIPISGGGWWYFTLTSSGAGGTARLYVNGDLKDQETIPSGFDVSNNRNFQVGQTELGDFPLNGTVDEPRVYDRALTGEAAKAAERVDVTVYNAGAEAVPEGTWVANLKKNGNVIESDTYNASSLDSEERITLNFYFSKLHPGGEYKIELEGTQTSTTVSC